MYSLVLYRSGDSAPEPASSCIRPTTSTYKFINSLDQIRYEIIRVRYCVTPNSALKNFLYLPFRTGFFC